MIAAARPPLSARQAFAALAYREVRGWWNYYATMLTSGWRVVGYVPAVAFVVFGIAGRVLGRSGSHAPLAIPHGWLAIGATFVPAMAFSVFGTAIITAVRRGPQLFQLNSPDPYLFAGSAMAPRHVVLWLLLLRSRVVRLAATAALALLFLPNTFGVSGGQGVAWVTTSRLLALLPAAFSLPVFALSRRLPRLPLREAGYVLVGFGMLVATAAAVAALGAGGPQIRQVDALLLAVPPGSFAYEAFRGDWLGVAGLLVMAAVGSVLTWWLAADCYPELFQGDQAHVQLAARRSGRAAQDLRTGVVSSRDGGVPPREWVLLWRWWVLERRLKPRTRLFVYGGAALAGAVAGSVMAGGPQWLSVAAAIAFALMASSSGNGFSQVSPVLEFRTPMWHLVAAPLGNRLRVLTLGNAMSMWSYMAVILLASGILRPALLPELAAGALSLAGYLWLRQSVELLFAILLPDSAAYRSSLVIFPIVTVIGLAVSMALAINFLSPYGPLAFLLPLVVLLPAGYAVTGLGARLLSGNEITAALASTR